MGEHVGAIDGNGLGDVLARKFAVRKEDEFGGVNGSKRLVKLRVISDTFAKDEISAREEAGEWGLVRIFEIEDKFGVGRDIKVGGDFGDGVGIKQGGAVDVEVIDGFGGRVKSGGLEGGRGEITDTAIRDEDITARFDRSGKSGAVGGKLKVGVADGGSET